MALTFSTDIRDQVCLILKGRVYSDCATADQTAIGGTEGAGPRALAQIQQWAHFFEMAGSDTAPESWKRWLIHLAAAEAAQFMRPDRESDLRRLAIDAQRDALKTYARAEIDGTAPDDLPPLLPSEDGPRTLGGSMHQEGDGDYPSLMA